MKAELLAGFLNKGCPDNLQPLNKGGGVSKTTYFAAFSAPPPFLTG